MLWLQFYCCAISATRIPRDQPRRSGTMLRSLSFLPSRFRRLCVVKALKDEPDGRSSGFAGQSWDPGLENEVPFEQRPVNEYSSLKNSMLYSWGELSPGSFLLRLGGLCLVTFTVLGAPIAAASFSPSKDPLRFALAAGTGTLLLASLAVLRIYLAPTEPPTTYYPRSPGERVLRKFFLKTEAVLKSLAGRENDMQSEHSAITRISELCEVVRHSMHITDDTYEGEEEQQQFGYASQGVHSGTQDPQGSMSAASWSGGPFMYPSAPFGAPSTQSGSGYQWLAQPQFP